MLVEPGKVGDIASVVAIHRAALSDDVLPTLGVGFLTDYYRCVMAATDQHLMVVRTDDRVEGFCLVSLRDLPIAALLRPRHLAAIVRLVVTRPRLAVSAVVQTTKSTVTNWDDAAEIAFIAVEPASSGRGYGRALMDRAAVVARDNGRRRVVTKTANARLADFYVRIFGAQRCLSFSSGGRDYSVLAWDVSSPPLEH